MPLVALSVWFGTVDTTAFGEGRCSRARSGRGTIVVLAVVAAYLLASLVWDELFTPYGRRDRQVEPQELHGALVRAWLSLLVVLPGLYGWIWNERVDWLVF